MDDRKGLSQIVSTVLLILLTVGAAAGIGAVVVTFVRTNLNNAGACNGVQGKLSLNPDYTCYYQPSGKVLISISRNDLAMQSILVAVSSDNSSRTFYLTDEPQNITGLNYYNSATSSNVTWPINESGKTYCLSGFQGTPTEIQISPRISNVQCGVVDSITSIPACTSSVAAGC
jgi:FlaG/FlaF family flagellin (archaellin)